MLRPGPALAHNPRSVVLARWLAFRGPAARKAASVEYCCRGGDNALATSTLHVLGAP